MPADCPPPSRIVMTTHGKVQGRRLVHAGDRQVDAFQGIPFAAPPIGELRFKKPQPPAPWAGVRETKKFAPRCIQVPFPGLLEDELHGEMSEDCLYLNVFTPCWEAPEEGFPVMVFIHGGAFVFGEASSYGDIGICENIASRGIVFVTIQYRLGYLGFLSTECGQRKCGSAASQSAFDNSKVDTVVHFTLYLVDRAGERVCNMKRRWYHISSSTSDLFHKAICMAGTAECRSATRSCSSMAAQSIRKAACLGVTEFANTQELLDKLRQIPAEKFAVSLFEAPTRGDRIDFGANFIIKETCPCLDGDFLPESLDALRAKATPKPLLNGVTKEEGLFLMPGRRSTLEGLQETLQYVTLDCTKQDAMKKELCSCFVGDAKPEDPACIRAQAGMVADSIFVAGHLELCRKTVAIQTEPIYLYVFEHFTGPSILGAFNPNGWDDSVNDLSVPWKPITKENPALNYVFTSNEPMMSNDLFEGRTAAFIEIHRRHK
ncbi:hypothetical protein PRIPAC_96534 [Pristionchus pacificus]|uniref:Esterase n=1 Tax=Pristionchus pacificus TaxID=54126 RepID=A0A2A6B2T2_PRIPA|nr:hypothetical protein PRIPAC_96534 [Pristionchus pacificus]|eukprot:PDM60185.1 esterase [Pristionchus pacificus]